MQVAGRYEWNDGNTVIYTNWGQGQPNNPTGGCVYFDYKDSTWYDADCNDKYLTVCKISTSKFCMYKTSSKHDMNHIIISKTV